MNNEKYEVLKEMLCEELSAIADSGEMTVGDLEVIDKLTHSIKSIVTIMAMEGGTSKKTAASRIADRVESMMDIADDDEVDALKDCLAKLRRSRA